MPGALLAVALAAGSAVGPAQPAAMPASPEARFAVRLCMSLEAPAEESLLACRQAAAASLPAEWSATIRGYLARRLAAQARWEEVIEIYRALGGARPSEAEWPRRLGAALLFGAGRPSEAEAALREALRRNGGSAATWALLGCALAARGRAAEAASALERAQSLDGEYLQVRPALLAVLEAARRGESWP
jgi:tetratricopeptide (TPR) repeat protein